MIRYAYMLAVLFWISLTGLCNSELCGTTREVFTKYPNQYFIETGTDYGYGIRAALAAGFPHIDSIDPSPRFRADHKRQFRAFPHVCLWYGQPTKMMGKIMRSIDVPITFYLRANYRGNLSQDTIMGSILDELSVIHRHPIKTHTIIIEGLRKSNNSARSPDFEYVSVYQFFECIEQLRKINPHYVFALEDGHTEQDLLVASIP